MYIQWKKTKKRKKEKLATEGLGHREKKFQVLGIMLRYHIVMIPYNRDREWKNNLYTELCKDAHIYTRVSTLF